MAVPKRFYSTWSEHNTLVSRLFVLNCIDESEAEESLFNEHSKSVNIRQKVGSPTSPRSLDGNNNRSTRLPSLSPARNGRLTSDDFVSEESNQLGGLKTSCEHLSDMVAAEADLEIYGFCSPRILKGLVPERFLPSLQIFRSNLTSSNNTTDIHQYSLVSTTTGSADIERLVKRFSGCPNVELQNEKGCTRNSLKRPNSKVVVCSNCGCYSLDK